MSDSSPAISSKTMVVLLSGSGTTLQNIIDRIEDGRLPNWRIARVISSQVDAYGLERARNHGIDSAVVSRKSAGNDRAFNAAVWKNIRDAEPDLVVMAGWMRRIIVPDDYFGRIINIHPALIPAFCGKGMYGHHVHEAVVNAGVKITGCTVHFVDAQYDHGPIIMQQAVEIDHTLTPDEVADKVQAAERDTYPKAIRLFGEGRLKIVGDIVRVLPARS